MGLLVCAFCARRGEEFVALLFRRLQDGVDGLMGAFEAAKTRVATWGWHLVEEGDDN